jgi:hypothetical protein
MSKSSYILNPTSSYKVKCTLFRGESIKILYRSTPAKDEFEALLDAQKNTITILYDRALFEIAKTT